MKYTKEYLRDNKIAISVESDDDKRGLSKIYGVFYPSNDMFFLRWDAKKSFFGWSCNMTNQHTQIEASKVIADYESSNPSHKILGYKYPFETYNGIQVKDKLIRVSGNRCVLNLGVEYYIALEIVEQWEPVYEEEKPTFGSFSDIIKHFKDCLVSIRTSIVIYDQDNSIMQLRDGEYLFADSFKKELTELGIKI